MKPALANQGGATFIELVAAVSVFAIVTVGLSPALLNARKAADFGKNQSIATALAQDRIEQIRGSGIGSCTNDASPLQPNGSSGGIFTRTCTSTANTPINGAYRVVVTVSWPDRPNTSSVTLVTVVRT